MHNTCQIEIRDKVKNLRRLEAQRNEINAKGTWLLLALTMHIHIPVVRLLREELTLLSEPGSHVGEIAKLMGKSKALVKVCAR